MVLVAYEALVYALTLSSSLPGDDAGIRFLRWRLHQHDQ